jgi:signal transduction histidine kinase
LVDDILDVSKISKGKIDFQREEFDLCDMVSEVVSQFRTMSDAANIQLDIDCCPNLIGYWDRFRIEQVVLNLLTNAVRYGEKKPIQVKVMKSGINAVISVKDQGMGIHAKDQERIFNRFERAISENEVSGLGLGLYISNEIVKAHGGSIRVVSAPKAGSEFNVTLPLMEAERNGK